MALPGIRRRSTATGYRKVVATKASRRALIGALVRLNGLLTRRLCQTASSPKTLGRSRSTRLTRCRRILRACAAPQAKRSLARWWVMRGAGRLRAVRLEQADPCPAVSQRKKVPARGGREQHHSWRFRVATRGCRAISQLPAGRSPLECHNRRREDRYECRPMLGGAEASVMRLAEGLSRSGAALLPGDFVPAAAPLGIFAGSLRDYLVVAVSRQRIVVCQIA